MYWTRGLVVERHRTLCDSDNNVNPPAHHVEGLLIVLQQWDAVTKKLRVPILCLVLALALSTQEPNCTARVKVQLGEAWDLESVPDPLHATLPSSCISLMVPSDSTSCVNPKHEFSTLYLDSSAPLDINGWDNACVYCFLG